MNPLDEYLISLYGYEILTGKAGKDFEQLSEEIAKYNCRSILETASKVTLKLYSKGFANPEVQVELVRDIFSFDIEIKKKLIEKVQDNNDKTWVVFPYQSVLALIKLALLKCDWEKGDNITEDKVINFGYWILQISDWIIGSEKSAKEMGAEDIRKHFAKQHFIMYSDRIPYMVGRFSFLFKTIIEDNRLNSKHIFKKATNGTDPVEYIQYCFYLIVNWINKTTKTPDISKEWVVCKDKYFEQTKLKTEDTERILDLLTSTQVEFINRYTQDIDNILSGTDNFIYNFVNFRKKPFIQYDEKCFICTYPKFLIEKTYDGFYWIVENYLRDNNLEDGHRIWPSMWGDALHLYVNECMSSAFKSQFFQGSVENGIEWYDGLVNLSKSILYIETKSIHFSLAAQIFGTKEDFSKTLKQLFSKHKGLGQIIKHIKDLRRGKWRLPFDQDNKTIIPLLITGQALPGDPLHRKLYEDLAKENDAYYVNRKIFPFLTLHIEELEMLEAIALEKGIEEAEQLLLHYAEIYRQEPNINGLISGSMTFKNFLDHNKIEVPNNKRLFPVFTNFASDATRKAFFHDL